VAATNRLYPWLSVTQTFSNCHDDKRFSLYTDRYRRGRDRMVVGLQLPMQSMTITTDVVSSNPAQARCARYNIM